MSEGRLEDLEQLTDLDEQPAPGGPNDPGASASDENQADTPGYSGGGDGDPTRDAAPWRSADDDAILDDRSNAPEPLDEDAQAQLEEDLIDEIGDVTDPGTAP